MIILVRFFFLFLGVFLIGSCGQHYKNTQDVTHSTHPNEQSSSQAGPINISVERATKLLNDPNVITIDLRTREEVNAGYIPGADRFMDYYIEFEKQLDTLDTHRTYLIYCRSGARSRAAAEMMAQKGFTHVYNLEGGIIKYNQAFQR